MSEKSIKTTSNPQWVFIKEGKHKGKTLRFVKHTEKRIGVQDESSLSSGKILYLLPEHVILCTRGDSTISNNEQPRPVSPGVDDVVPKDTTWVRIIAGKHRGKTLRFIKRTKQRVAVEIEDGKIVYLLPDHIQLENEEISIITTQPLRDATTPLPVSPSSESSSNMDDDESSYDFISAVTTLSEKNDNNDEKDGSISTVSEKKIDNEEKDVPVSTVGVVHENMNSLTMNDKILIRRGAHVGKMAIFVRYTGKRVAVKLEEESTIRYLCPSSLEPNKSMISQEDEINPMVLAISSLSRNDNENKDDDTPVSTVGVVQKNSNSLTTGDKIIIQGGNHAGKTAFFVKCTGKRVAIKLEGESTIRYLCPGSLEPKVSAISPEDENDPMVQAIQRHLPNNYTTCVKNVTHFLLERTLFGVIFGEYNPVFFDIKTTSISNIPQNFIQQDQTFHLSCVKLHDKAKSLTCTYIPAQSNQRIINHLLQIGAFDKLTPHKTCARLELLLSTAAHGDHIHKLYPSDFCFIPEQGNVGCGFIPRRMIDSLLMGTTASTQVCALQVRIVIPSMGIFKGMLMEKLGIKKIELPPSMKKVDAVRMTPDGNAAAAAWIMINKTGIYPYMARIQQAENSFQEKRVIPEQARWMLVQKGASQTYVQEPNRQFSSLVGVADPTNSIPPGCVFISGICDLFLDDDDDDEEFGDEVALISRFPMTEALDGRILPIIREKKPPSMSIENWEFLRSKPFGLVIFGNPSTGDRPMPEQIAQGDLDGDDYFVTWDRTIIQDAVIGGEAIFAQKNNPSGSPSPPSCWWAESQEYMSNIEERKRSNLLFACLHGRWLNKLRNGLQDDAVYFGRAYKESLAAAKHGRKVSLPRRLWAQIPHNLHHFLQPLKMSYKLQ